MRYDSIFNWIHGNHLVYNACWEDPRLDRAALELDTSSRVLVITSAGCNALDYVIAGAGKVYAVDVNPRQNALLELKLAALRALSYSEFFLLFGRGYHPNFNLVYRSQLRRFLSASAQAFWDSRPDLFTVNKRVRGFYDRGTSGLVARTMYWHIRTIAKVEEAVEAIFACSSLEEQRSIYFNEIKPRIWKGFLRATCSSPILLSLLGIPRSQRDLIVKSQTGGIPSFIETALDSVFGTLPLRDNYFWRAYLLGGYSETCCPEYLTEKGFQGLKQGLWERISLHTMTVSKFLQKHSEPITHAVLLDHMDWLYARDTHELQHEWQALVDRSPGTTRVIWRSAAEEVPDLVTLPVQTMGKSVALGQLLSFNRAKADELHIKDRVHTYQSFHIANLTPSLAA
jgi:S-adenosylmethionine-diacylglycerol 3-amino-3-carboxypropyl transferase